MPEQFWIKEYRKKAKLDDPIQQSGRGKIFEAVELMYVIKQVVDLLDLERYHNLLDVEWFARYTSLVRWCVL
jgi:hypothetical protein